MQLQPERSALRLPLIAPRDRLCVALDVPDAAAAEALAREVAPHAGVVKVGLELFLAEGRSVVERVAGAGTKVFLDLKLCDIPETVARAVRALHALPVDYLTVHASGGRAMLEAAAAAAHEAPHPVTVLAVTVLTSLDEGDLAELGVGSSPSDHVQRLARLAVQSGIHGLVCSAAEASALRHALGAEVVLVTPGVRPLGESAGDQKRVVTPAEAIRRGADLLVVGRPIRDAPSPREAAAAVEAAIERALSEPSEEPSAEPS